MRILRSNLLKFQNNCEQRSNWTFAKWDFFYLRSQFISSIDFPGKKQVQSIYKIITIELGESAQRFFNYSFVQMAADLTGRLSRNFWFLKEFWFFLMFVLVRFFLFFKKIFQGFFFMAHWAQLMSRRLLLHRIRKRWM